MGAGVTAIAWGIGVLVFCHGTVKMVCLLPATLFPAGNTKPQIKGVVMFFVCWKLRMSFFF